MIVCDKRLAGLVVGITAAALARAAWGQSRPADDVADVPSRECRAGGDENKQYFFIGPRAGAEAPTDGYSLLVVIPGGDGGAGFQPFVKRVFKNALSDRYVVAQLVAHKWTPEQKIVWPSQKDRVADARFRTEEFVNSVVEDVRKTTKINPKRIFMLAWSSGGPAAYAVSLRPEKPVTGSLIAMSVFAPLVLPPLDRSKGHAYYLLHSPDDKVCVFDFAKQAMEYLSAQGATVTLATYPGGHGWHGDVFGEIRTGIEWLEQHAGRSAEDVAAAAQAGQPGSPIGRGGGEGASKSPESPTVPAKPLGARSADAGSDPAGRRSTAGSEAPAASRPAAVPAPVLPPGTNLVLNGGFENGTAGWMILNNSGRATIEADRQVKREGGRSLKISKKGGPPIDVVRQNIGELPKSKKLVVTAQVRAQDAKNAFLKFFIYDAKDNPIREDVDVEHIVGTWDWKKVERTYELPENAVSAAVMLVLVLDGTVWVDDVQVAGAE